MTSRRQALVPPTVRAAARSHKRFPYAFARRFFLLLALGVLWAVPAFWDSRFLLVMAAWDLCAVIAWAIDLKQLAQPHQLIVHRVWSGPASLSNHVEVTLEMQNLSGASVECRLLDDVPSSLRNVPPDLVVKAGPRRNGSACYTARPLQRGDIKLAGVWLRYQSPAHFAERWAFADLQQKIRVFPDLEEAKRHNIYLSRARQIELEKRLIRQRGTGREFESLREYQPGDEFRDICWTATARRGKHVTKLYQVERSQAVWIVMDAGRLLRARVGELSKLDLSVNAALSLAQIALYSGDRTGLLVYGRNIQQRVGLGRGIGHMRAILEALASAHEEAAEADHLRAASALLQMQRQRGLIIWITDLADTSMTPEVVESASRILSKHLLLFAVIAQTDLQRLANKYPENPEQMFEIMAAQELVQRRETLLARVRGKGALALEISPDALTTVLVNRYLEVKERGLI
ncbi:MAG TPA: DUF58 domain-containing protein [Candidatus Acidoferrales bacterium]|jgi:uncharacterized protein (DUF58 family)|nr:DUF58 domain-containing protein [Candidatus Acidoferrales bacterium]